MACARCVEVNPVRGRLARRARDWRWSSAWGHLAGEEDGLVRVRRLLAVAPAWRGLLAEGLGAADHEAIRAGERSGRPLGSARFVARIEKRLARKLARQKPGPKPKADPTDAKR